MNKKICRCLKNKNGIALATVLLVFSVVTVLGFSVVSFSLSEYNSAIAAENNTAAYYIARSAVEITGSKIKEKADAVESAYQAVLTAGLNTRETMLIHYETAKNNFNALDIIPDSVGETRTVYIDGVQSASLPVTVSRVLEGSDEYIDVSCTATENDVPATATLRLFSYKETLSSVEVTRIEDVENSYSWDGGNPIYSWGDVNFGRNTLFLGGGNVQAGGTVSGVPGTGNIHRDMPIFMPPSQYLSPEYDKTGSVMKRNMASGQLISYLSITSADSGYYGDLSVREMNWHVSTTGPDDSVVLVFNSLEALNNGDIYVTGQGKLYIYILEDYSAGDEPEANKLVNFKNNFNVLGLDSNLRPNTYIIVCNDNAQKYYNETGSNIIPADEAGDIEPLDTVYFKNGTDLQAYLYLPGCEIELQNNTTAFGSIYASKFKAKNNTGVHFRSFADSGNVFGDFSIVTSETVTVNIPFILYEYSGDMLWKR